MARYLLDSNVFIEAFLRYYGFNICPAFWSWLIEQNNIGNVASISKVAEELYKQEDELSKWAKLRGESFFLPLDSKTAQEMGEIGDTVERKHDKNHVHVFMGGADLSLIAYARVHDFTVITQEITKPTRAKIKIPAVCKEFSIECLDTFKMLEKGGARFILKSPQNGIR